MWRALSVGVAAARVLSVGVAAALCLPLPPFCWPWNGGARSLPRCQCACLTALIEYVLCLPCVRAAAHLLRSYLNGIDVEQQFAELASQIATLSSAAQFAGTSGTTPIGLAIGLGVGMGVPVVAIAVVGWWFAARAAKLKKYAAQVVTQPQVVTQGAQEPYNAF
jgi:hypothetical protein